MTIKYINLCKSVDDLWADRKSVIEQQYYYSIKHYHNTKRAFIQYIAWLILAVIGMGLLAFKVDAYVRIAYAALFLSVAIGIVTPIVIKRRAKAEMEYYTLLFHATNRDEMLSALLQSPHLTTSKQGISLIHSSAVLSHIILNDLVMSECIVDRDMNELRLLLKESSTPISIHLSAVKKGELDCLTLLENGSFLGKQEDVCKSNIIQTLPIHLEASIVERPFKDYLKEVNLP